MIESTDSLVALMERRRWPDGVSCLRCSSLKITRIRTRPVFQCENCAYQFSVKTDTVMHDSKLPVTLWMGVAAMLASRPLTTTGDIQRAWNVSHKTAWLLRRKIRERPDLFYDSDRYEARNPGVLERRKTYPGAADS